MSETYYIKGIEYSIPKVELMFGVPLMLAEFAARTCYNSFSKLDKDSTLYEVSVNPRLVDVKEDIESSELVNRLVNTNFHESIMEHINFTFSIRGLSRGALQELSRHRLASYSVKSTRYTGGVVLNAYNASLGNGHEGFMELLPTDMFTVHSEALNLEVRALHSKLTMMHQQINDHERWKEMTMSSSQVGYIDKEENSPQNSIFKMLQELPQKRNVYDPFKWTVTDNWSTDVVMTINARSLKNLLKLRDSGAAWFQIQTLAKEMKKVIPEKYQSILWKTKKYK